MYGGREGWRVKKVEDERVRRVENVTHINSIRLHMSDLNRETEGLPERACSCPTVG